MGWKADGRWREGERKEEGKKRDKKGDGKGRRIENGEGKEEGRQGRDLSWMSNPSAATAYIRSKLGGVRTNGSVIDSVVYKILDSNVKCRTKTAHIIAIGAP